MSGPPKKRARTTTAPAPPDVCANGTDTAAQATDARPAASHVEAVLTEVVQIGSSSLAGCSSDRHEHSPLQRDAPLQPPAECFSVDVLKERALAMFIGDGEMPRASDYERTMEYVTAGLVINVTKAIEELMGTPRKPGSHRAEMVRCCGELDKEEARGWLIADAVGRPLLHRNDDRSQNDARDVGKRVLEREGKMKQAVATARETATAALRAAQRAAAKDPALQQGVIGAEANRDVAVANARAQCVELDIPNVTVGSKRPDSYWRSREVQQAEGAAARAAAQLRAAKAAVIGAQAREERAAQAARKPDAPESSTNEWFARMDQTVVTMQVAHAVAVVHLEELKQLAEIEAAAAREEANEAAAVEAAEMAAAQEYREDSLERMDLELMCAAVAMVTSGHATCVHCAHLLVRRADDLSSEDDDLGVVQPTQIAGLWNQAWKRSLLFTDTLITARAWRDAVAEGLGCHRCTGPTLTAAGQAATKQALLAADAADAIARQQRIARICEIESQIAELEAERDADQ